MSDARDPITILERVRELEGEMAGLYQELAARGSDEAGGAIFKTLEVRVCGTWFLIPIDRIREVVAMAWPEPVTGAPEWIVGTVSYGPQTTTLVDLGLRMSGETSSRSDESLIVVIEGRRWFGLVVDSVGDVRSIDPEKVMTPGPGVPCSDLLIGTAIEEDGTSISLLSARRLAGEVDA